VAEKVPPGEFVFDGGVPDGGVLAGGFGIGTEYFMQPVVKMRRVAVRKVRIKIDRMVEVFIGI
jgi:hypothetical protein